MSIGSQTSSPYYPFWPYYGYFSLGPVQIPPLPRLVGMTDRATNTVWYLGFDPSAGNGTRMVLYDTLTGPDLLRTKVYGPYDGPYLGATGYRLGVRNGRLVFDMTQGDGGPPVWVRDFATQLTVYRLEVNQSPPFSPPLRGGDPARLEFVAEAVS